VTWDRDAGVSKGIAALISRTEETFYRNSNVRSDHC